MDNETTNKTSGEFIPMLKDAAAGVIVGTVKAIGFGLRVSARVLLVGGSLILLGTIGKKTLDL
jgi:hypothetical protein